MIIFFAFPSDLRDLKLGLQLCSFMLCKQIMPVGLERLPDNSQSVRSKSEERFPLRLSGIENLKQGYL